MSKTASDAAALATTASTNSKTKPKRFCFATIAGQTCKQAGCKYDHTPTAAEKAATLKHLSETACKSMRDTRKCERKKCSFSHDSAILDKARASLALTATTLEETSLLEGYIPPTKPPKWLLDRYGFTWTPTIIVSVGARETTVIAHPASVSSPAPPVMASSESDDGKASSNACSSTSSHSENSASVLIESRVSEQPPKKIQKINTNSLSDGISDIPSSVYPSRSLEDRPLSSSTNSFTFSYDELLISSSRETKLRADSTDLYSDQHEVAHTLTDLINQAVDKVFSSESDALPISTVLEADIHRGEAKEMGRSNFNATSNAVIESAEFILDGISKSSEISESLMNARSLANDSTSPPSYYAQLRRILS